jgi:hypothetical protein
MGAQAEQRMSDLIDFFADNSGLLGEKLLYTGVSLSVVAGNDQLTKSPEETATLVGRRS